MEFANVSEVCIKSMVFANHALILQCTIMVNASIAQSTQIILILTVFALENIIWLMAYVQVAQLMKFIMDINAYVLMDTPEIPSINALKIIFPLVVLISIGIQKQTLASVI